MSFRNTRWSLVESSAGDSPRAHTALRELCALYWQPLYAFLRDEGQGKDQALETVQGFLARVLEKRDLRAEPSKGRFRSYIIGALRNYVRNEKRSERAQIRGGTHQTVALDALPSEERQDAEEHYRVEARDRETPSALFDRRWALTILANARARLRDEYRERGREAIYEELAFALTGEASESNYGEKASRLGISESAVKVSVHRLRRRMGEVIRDEVAQTLHMPSAEDVDEEVRHLFEALSR